MPTKKIPNPQVAATFASYPKKIQQHLMKLRALILDTAKANPVVGPIEETLKWGEPAYLTSQTSSGSTIRLGWKPSRPHHYAIYFNCRTTLVESFKTLFHDLFQFEGNRSIVFAASEAIPRKELQHCIEMALTYHLNK